MALTRTKQTYDLLSKQKDHLKQYNQIIQDQLNLEFIEKVDQPIVTKNTHYLPHLRVIKDSPTTPVRMVFDCSAHAHKGGVSLNDCLMKGPSLVEKLGKMLLKFIQTDLPSLVI